jgi:hypothetical protein
MDYFIITVLCIVVIAGGIIAIGFLVGMEHEHKAARKPRVYSAKDADADGWINVGTVGPGESFTIDLSDSQPKD